MAYFTLAEAAKRRDLAGAPIAEELNRRSALLGLMLIEIIPGGVKKYGVRAALPNIGFRGANEAITQTYSVINPYEETTMIAESNPWLDKAVVYGSPEEALAVEALAHVEKIRQIASTAIFYGDKEADYNSIDGLNNRLLYNSGNGQVVSASGTGSDLMSIWVLSLGEGRVQGFAQSPEDMLQVQYLGMQKHPTLGVMGYQGHVFLRMGLALCAADAAAQVANIESAGSSNILTQELLNDAIERVANPTAIFANRQGMLQIQKLFEGKVTFGADQFGRRFTDYGGLPVYREDSLVITESAKS